VTYFVEVVIIPFALHWTEETGVALLRFIIHLSSIAGELLFSVVCICNCLYIIVVQYADTQELSVKN